MSSNNLFAAIANFCIFFTLVSILLLKLAESYDESNQNLLVDTEHIGMALLFSHCLLLIICVCMAYYACRHTSEGDFLEAGFETYFKEKEEEEEDGRPRISKKRSSKLLLFSESPSCDEKDIQKIEDDKMNFKEFEGIEINSSFRKKKLFDESDQSKSDEDDEELGLSGLNDEIAPKKFGNNVEIIPSLVSKYPERKFPLKKKIESGNRSRTKKEESKKLPRRKGRKRRKKKAKMKGQTGPASKFEV